MSGQASTTYADQVLSSYLNNVADGVNLVDAGSATSLYVSLHTAALTASSTQATSEAAYTGYARVAVTRSSGSPQWTVSSGSGTNVAAITFPACTGGSETELWFAIGTAATGTGQVLVAGPLSAGLAVSSGITPSFAIGAATITAQ